MSVTMKRPTLLLSELVKLLTLRSVWITVVVTVVTCVAMAGLTAGSLGEAIIANDPNLAPGTIPETVGLEWIGLGLIGIAIVGVIAGSSEYTGQQVKSSLLAVPNRWRLVGFKASALLLVVALMGMVAIPAMSLLSQIGLGEVGVIDAGIPATLVSRWMGGIALWLATALIGFALGLLMRQSLIPLLIMIVVSQLTLPLVNLVPFAQYLPFAAGTQLYDPAMITGSTPGAALTPEVAGAALGAWTGVLLVAAIVRFYRRDVQL